MCWYRVFVGMYTVISVVSVLKMRAKFLISYEKGVITHAKTCYSITFQTYCKTPSIGAYNLYLYIYIWFWKCTLWYIQEGTVEFIMRVKLEHPAITDAEIDELLQQHLTDAIAILHMRMGQQYWYDEAQGEWLLKEGHSNVSTAVCEDPEKVNETLHVKFTSNMNNWYAIPTTAFGTYSTDGVYGII